MENIYELIKKEEKKKQKENRDALIAEKVRQVLKSKMILKQKILAQENDNNAISFAEFVEKLNNIVRRLETMEREDPDRLEVEDEYRTFLNQHADKVILKDYEIDHLLSYVKASIMRFGVPRNKEEYTSAELVKYALLILDDFINEYYQEKDNELGRWLDLICSSESAGFYNKTKEVYKIKGYGNNYFTIRDYHHNLYSISAKGEENLNEEIDFSNELLLSELYIGSVNLKDTRVLTILSSKEGNLYPIYFDNKCASYAEELEMYKKLDIKVITSFSSALKYTGMSQFIEPLYDKQMLEHIAIAMNERQHLASFNSFITNDMPLSDGEIPAEELSICASSINGSWRFGVMRKKENIQELNNGIEPITRVNEILELVGLSHLIEDSYDPRKLEYILLAIKEDGSLPSIITSEETINVSLPK